MENKDNVWETVKGKYKIISHLGEGAFGQVMAAKNRETG